MSNHDQSALTPDTSSIRERLTERFWLSVMWDAVAGQLPELTSGRVIQLRKMVRSWREPDAIDELASLIAGR